MDGVVLPFPEPPAQGTQLSNKQAMQLAIDLAQRGVGFVAPNPPVGCVVLDPAAKLLSYGYHEKFGGPHAEVNALKGLTNEQLQGASVFVTLEPCAHHGKTPPCADLLASKPLAKVYYGLQDPNPKVNGGGAQTIRDAGIEVELFSELQDELQECCEHFLYNQTQKLPFVSLKVATSLDGMMALNTGESKWITGEEARTYAHHLRASHQAIMVGQGTFSMDNPSLNIRHPRYPEQTNTVVILDPTGGSVEELAQSQVVQCHPPEKIIYVVTEGTESELRGQVEPWAQIMGIKHQKREGFDLNQLLKKLWDYGIHSVLVEGGGETLGSFLRTNLAQRLYLFQAPLVLGAGNGLSWTEGLSIHRMDGKKELGVIKRHMLGKDQLISGRFLGYNGG